MIPIDQATRELALSGIAMEPGLVDLLLRVAQLP